MARLHTLYRDMTDGDLLAFKCRGCGASFAATRRQAIKRFGPSADPLYIRVLSRCRTCGSSDIEVTFLPGAAWSGYGAGAASRLSQAQRQNLTMAECKVRGWRVFGSCDTCENQLQPGTLERMIAAGTGDRPFAKMIANRSLACRICDGFGRIERVLVLDEAGEPMAEYMLDWPGRPKMKQTSKAVIRRLLDLTAELDFSQNTPPAGLPSP